MKISYNWLKWYLPDAPDANKIADVLTYHLTEVEDVEKKEDGDTVFDINILPNRAHDLLSHQGVARELSGQLAIPFSDPTSKYKIPESKSTDLKIEINTDKCRRFSARIVHGIKVGPSPEWVVKHLESIGQRSINNIVDATNIVMYDCGQPTHAFDLRNFKDNKIEILDGVNNQELKLIGRDQIVAKLEPTDILIKNSDDEILSLAGIKGGLNSGVSDDTTELLIEVANFDPSTIRKTARRIGILSDSAKRFENDLSPELCTFGMMELSAFIAEMFPDAVFEEVVDHYKNVQEKKTISFTTEFINKKLGDNILDQDVEKILKNYNFKYVQVLPGQWEIEVPHLRLDLENAIDMAEEIGRIYGYDKLIPILPKISSKTLSLNSEYEKIKSARNYLLSEGYREVMTYSFTDKGKVEILKSASDKNFLRTNLTDGIKKSYEINKLNAPFLGLDEIKIFEIGSIFTKNPNDYGEEVSVCFANKKEIKEMSLYDFVKNYTSTTSYTLPTTEKNEALFEAWSTQPFVVRDLSLWVNSDTDKEIVLDIIKKEGNELLVKEPRIVDRFEKDGKISYAFRMIFQSSDRTLTDEEVNKIMQSITDSVIEKGFTPR